MNKLIARLIVLFLFVLFCRVGAAPLTINLTNPVDPAAASPYGPGAFTDPKGHTLTLDTECFEMDGKPFIPIMGEFHYSRYPESEWREELLKMKADGLTGVSCYIFWIHQEEIQGQFDWTGQRSLRRFLILCKQVGLQVFVRLGPWDHGEARNGGFPDWVQNSGYNLRSNDPRYLALVKQLFAEEAQQMAGLYWKDGGPVIGVQLENECDNAPYMLTLKQMAKDAGIDVPFYAQTGWQGGLPQSGLVPMFGGYTDGFWDSNKLDFRKDFFPSAVRATGDLGADMNSTAPADSAIINQYPYACVEIGGGMQAGYDRRIFADPETVASEAQTKLGDGNNLPGYYMFQGGVNPDGKHTNLNEANSNRLPVKDYDFYAPLGAAGQIRPQYHLLREQHLFIQDVSKSLASMPAYFPDIRPNGLNDLTTLRWSVRWNGSSGYLFFNNRQPILPLPDHPDVQFQLTTANGDLLIPEKPITIDSGCYGILPINLNCSGVTVRYATAQYLCHIESGSESVYFFKELPGIRPELEIVRGNSTVCCGGKISDTIVPTISLKQGPEHSVSFVVLSSEQAVHFWRFPFAGQERAILSNCNIVEDGGRLNLESENPRSDQLSILPGPNKISFGSEVVHGDSNGIFETFRDPRRTPSKPLDVSVALVAGSSPGTAGLDGTLESTWDGAAVYRLNIPDAAKGRKILLNFHYTGDAARVYVGNKLFEDNYYNGREFPIALWRIAPSDWGKITLKVLPYSDTELPRFDQPTINIVNAAKTFGTLDAVTVTAVEYIDRWVEP